MRLVFAAACGAVGVLALAGCSTTSSDTATDAEGFNWQSGVTSVAFDPNTDDATNDSDSWAVNTTGGSGSGKCSPSSTATTCTFTEPFGPGGSSTTAVSASSSRYGIGPITLTLSDGATVTLNTCTAWNGIEGSVSCSP